MKVKIIVLVKSNVFGHFYLFEKYIQFDDKYHFKFTQRLSNSICEVLRIVSDT